MCSRDIYMEELADSMSYGLDEGWFARASRAAGALLIVVTWCPLVEGYYCSIRCSG